MIDILNIYKTYGKIEAVRDVSFHIDGGEFISLVGSSGAGKSTLIRILTLGEKPTKGKILISGHEITKLKRSQVPYYRRLIGVVFQDYKLLSKKTVWENIAFAMEVSDKPSREIRQNIPRILDLVGLSEKAHSFPAELSGGEKQRVAIARALINSPKLLIADEPTGNLDPINSWEIIQLLLKINKAGTTVLLATHNKEIVDSLKRRVITMEAGTVVFDQKVGKYRL